MRHTSCFTLLIALALAASTMRAQERRPIKIFIFTAPVTDGFVDAESKQRVDTVADLKAALQGNGDMSFVDARADADVVLEVLSRGREQTGTVVTTTERGLFGSSSSSREKVNARVHVQLTAGTYSKEIVGNNDGRVLGEWKTAARNAAKQISTWVKDNKTRLTPRP